MDYVSEPIFNTTPPNSANPLSKSLEIETKKTDIDLLLHIFIYLLIYVYMGIGADQQPPKNYIYFYTNL